MAGLVLLLLAARTAMAQIPFSDTAKPAPTARVIEVQDPGATAGLAPVPERIQAMVDCAITNLTGKTIVRDSWRSLVSTQDIVGIKVYSAPGPNSGTRPAVAAAVIQDLLSAGLPPGQIVIWDRNALDLRLAGYFELGQRYGVRVLDTLTAGYDQTNFYETALIGKLTWTDSEFGKTGAGVGRKSYVSKLVSQAITKIINISPLMHHNLAGVSGNLYTLAVGSVDNTARFEAEGASLARAIPEINALPILGDRVALNIVDALVCQYEGQDLGLLHYSAVLNELRFSRDPVALDVLSLEEIERQRRLTGDEGIRTNSVNRELFSNASLLEIGVSDRHRIQVEKITLGAQK